MCSLPLQISFEVHLKHLYTMTNFDGDANYWGNLYWALHEISAAETSVLFNHLAFLGCAILPRNMWNMFPPAQGSPCACRYGIVGKELNSGKPKAT